MNEREKFLHEKLENIRKMGADNAVRDLGIEFAKLQQITNIPITLNGCLGQLSNFLKI